MSASSLSCLALPALFAITTFNFATPGGWNTGYKAQPCITLTIVIYLNTGIPIWRQLPVFLTVCSARYTFQRKMNIRRGELVQKGRMSIELSGKMSPRLLETGARCWTVKSLANSLAIARKKAAKHAARNKAPREKAYEVSLSLVEMSSYQSRSFLGSLSMKCTGFE